jgi:hypothetical protein
MMENEIRLCNWLGIYPVAVAVTDDYTPELSLQASSFSFRALTVKYKVSQQKESSIQDAPFSVWLDDKHLLSSSINCSISKGNKLSLALPMKDTRPSYFFLCN